VKWLARWWPALVWAAVIFNFSTGTFTSENTSRFIIPSLHWLFPHAAPETLELTHHLIRKCGHLTEYFILSLLFLRGIRSGRPGVRLRWALTAILLVAAYASLDEFHQLFVPGRTAAVTDVMLDTAGGAAAQLAAAFFLSSAKSREEQERQRGS